MPLRHSPLHFSFYGILVFLTLYKRIFIVMGYNFVFFVFYLFFVSLQKAKKRLLACMCNRQDVRTPSFVCLTAARATA